MRHFSTSRIAAIQLSFRFEMQSTLFFSPLVATRRLARCNRSAGLYWARQSSRILTSLLQHDDSDSTSIYLIRAPLSLLADKCLTWCREFKAYCCNAWSLQANLSDASITALTMLEFLLLCSCHETCSHYSYRFWTLDCFLWVHTTLYSLSCSRTAFAQSEALKFCIMHHSLRMSSRRYRVPVRWSSFIFQVSTNSVVNCWLYRRGDFGLSNNAVLRWWHATDASIAIITLRFMVMDFTPLLLLHRILCYGTIGT